MTKLLIVDLGHTLGLTKLLIVNHPPLNQPPLRTIKMCIWIELKKLLIVDLGQIDIDPPNWIDTQTVFAK